MKLPIVVTILALVLTGCSSPKSELPQRLYNSEDISSTYCNMEGFAKFYESDRYYSFQCKDGSKFRIPK